MEDARIVELFWQRDESAIAAVDERYGSRLLGIARGILGDEGAAEECVNDALLEAWDRIPPHRPGEYLFPFLARITRAKALNRVKALSADKRSAGLISLTDELAEILRSPENTEETVEAEELSRAVSRFLWGLTEKKRQVFLRRYWYADPLSEIGRRYGMSESGVKSLLWRTRQELKDFLQKEGLL